MIGRLRGSLRPDKLDYDRFALVVSGVETVIGELTK